MTIENLSIKLTATDMDALRRIRKKLTACRKEVSIREDVDRFMAIDKGETILFEILMAGFNWHDEDFNRRNPEAAAKLEALV
jgi:hypothetical protein